MPTVTRNELCPFCHQKRKRCTCSAKFRNLLWWGLIVAALISFIVARRMGTATHSSTAGPVDIAREESIAKECDQVLRDLVLTHPDRAIRDTLDGLIKSGAILKNYQVARGIAGGTLASVELLNDPDTPEPILRIDPNILLDPQIDRRAKQMFLRHEYVHLRQLIDGRVPRQTFFPRSTDIPWTNDELRSIMIVEWEAYLAEAKFAAREQCLDAIPMISAYQRGPRALAASIASDYLQAANLKPFASTIKAVLDSLALAEQ